MAIRGRRSLLAAQPPSITSAKSVGGEVGKRFGYRIKATNRPTAFSAVNLPAGLMVDPTLGTITGTPMAGGTSDVTISATNAAGTGSATLTIAIKSAPQAPVITSAKAAGGKVGKPFSYAIKATNHPTSFGATGLPHGISIDTMRGTISGTPTQPGSFQAHISASNSIGVGTFVLTLSIKGGEAPVIKSATSAAGKVGKHFGYTIKATNGPTRFGAIGLPSGLAVDSSTGAIAGTPSAAGISNVMLWASNQFGTGTEALAIAVTIPASGDAPFVAHAFSGRPPSLSSARAGASSAWVAPPAPPIAPIPQAAASGTTNSAPLADIAQHLMEVGRQFASGNRDSSKLGIAAASGLAIFGLITILAMTESGRDTGKE
jgi:hypothetical protein